MISTSAAPTQTDARFVGGKAASLFRLIQIGCDVPPFFVLTARTPSSQAEEETLDPATRSEVLDAWAEMAGPRHGWAVRSSAVGEDSAENSFAGVFDTILDVRGEEALLSAIERCLASHRGEAAQSYRRTRGVEGDDAMAVVVQRMVQAEWAGVSFTADPLTQSLSTLVINAVAGGGDKLVSGLVNPEEIKIEAASGRVLEARRPEGAAPLPEAIRDAVAEISLKVAAALGFPQDLEWAVEDDRLWLLQSRPITTVAGVFHNRPLEPWGDGGRPDDPARVWSRAYADEIWAPPVSPLFYDVQNLTVLISGYLRHGGDTAPLPPDIFKYFRAAAYIDVDVLHRIYSCLPRMARRSTVLDLLPPDRRDALAGARWSFWGALQRAWLFEIVHRSRWGVTRNHRFLEANWPRFLASARPLMDVDLRALDDAGLAAHLQEVWAVAGIVGVECQVAVVYYAHDIKLLLLGLLDRWCGDADQRYSACSSGLEASQTVRESEAIWNIAREIRDAGLADLARTKSWNDFRAHTAEESAGDVVAAIHSFLLEHRHRGAHYKDLIHPRWGDDPELLWSQIKGFLDADIRPPGAANAHAAAARRDAQNNALTAVRGAAAPLWRAVLRALFHLNEVYTALRDNHRFYYDHIWWLLRRIYLEMGRRLHARGLLADPTAVFFLCRRELAELADGALARETAADRIVVRRAEWTLTLREQPAKFLRHGYAPDGGVSGEEGAARLTGQGASAGEAIGRAVVVFDIADLGRVSRGDILVTRQTDPSWTPAFSRLGGLVLETGGVLAHGASLCREFGLPCVTAVERATAHIHDGDMIKISGSLGVIEVLAQDAGGGV
jgi:phosphohistidine swiveling domain-containing protein